MKIIVLIKEVPDMEKVKFDSSRGVVDRSSAPAEINPFDESALQAALELKDRCGAWVCVLTMGPPQAELEHYRGLSFPVHPGDRDAALGRGKNHEPDLREKPFPRMPLCGKSKGTGRAAPGQKPALRAD